MARVKAREPRAHDEFADQALQEIDRLAESVRDQLITPRPGVAQARAAKLLEAQRYPNDPPFPYLQKEAKARGISVEELRDIVLDNRRKFDRMDAEIEAVRIESRMGVREAVTKAQIASALHGAERVFAMMKGEPV